jgi:hypothetical protein
VRSVGIKQYGFKKKKGHYSHHKKLNLIKRKRKKTTDDTGADLICGDPNMYLKDMYYLSDKSEDFKFDEIEKCKNDLAKFKEKKRKIEEENEQAEKQQTENEIKAEQPLPKVENDIKEKTKDQQKEDVIDQQEQDVNIQEEEDGKDKQEEEAKDQLEEVSKDLMEVEVNDQPMIDDMQIHVVKEDQQANPSTPEKTLMPLNQELYKGSNEQRHAKSIVDHDAFMLDEDDHLGSHDPFKEQDLKLEDPIQDNLELPPHVEEEDKKDEHKDHEEDDIGFGDLHSPNLSLSPRDD